MKRFLNTTVSVLVCGLLLASIPGEAATTTKSKAKATTAPAKAPARNTISRNPYIGAIVVDAASGKVLVEDQPDAQAYPASVLKLMDLLIVLEQVQAGKLSLQDRVTASTKASKTGGSQVWLAEKESFTVDDLLYALMVQSANDVAVALAEKVAGSTEAFVQMMNQRAQQLGMTQTRFQSVHGLPPGPGQQADVTTARDLSLLCRELLKHPDTLRYTSTRERTFRPGGLVMRTHNHVMTQFEGCDGLKTGYFLVAGYSIAATASRNGQRVIAVVLGSQDRKVRDAKTIDLLSKGLLAATATAPAPLPQPTAPPPRPAAPKAGPARK